jgi:pantoate--beta-alanine ligase
MGALHKGHLSLLDYARKENDISSCSIFVNPIQFNNPEDLKKYPRNIEKDLSMLEEKGCDAVLVPSVDEIYPEPDNTVYDFGHLDKVMEGKFRPGHFNGVAIVVRRLFEIFEPDRAYFGEKDFQQLVIIQHLVRQLKLNIEIIPCPIIREDDGLAMSSRNVRLNPKQRQKAPVIYQTLLDAKYEAINQPLEKIKEHVRDIINKQGEMKLEYFEIVDTDTLLPVDSMSGGKSSIACIAVYLGDVRLIDNIRL